MRGRIVQLISAVCLSSLFSAPSYAWDKIKEDGRCGFGQTFEGPGNTTVVISQNREQFDTNEVMVVIGNDNWSIKVGDTIKDLIKFDAENYAFWAEPYAADRLLILLMPFAHVDGFADSLPRSVAIYKGKEKIDQLNFEGFFGAFVLFEACRSPWLREKATKDRLEALERSLPRDPFAKSADANKAPGEK